MAVYLFLFCFVFSVCLLFAFLCFCSPIFLSYSISVSPSLCLLSLFILVLVSFCLCPFSFHQTIYCFGSHFWKEEKRKQLMSLTSPVLQSKESVSSLIFSHWITSSQYLFRFKLVYSVLSSLQCKIIEKTSNNTSRPTWLDLMTLQLVLFLLLTVN